MVCRRPAHRYAVPPYYHAGKRRVATGAIYELMVTSPRLERWLAARSDTADDGTGTAYLTSAQATSVRNGQRVRRPPVPDELAGCSTGYHVHFEGRGRQVRNPLDYM
jgi:hypothetical protein